MKPSLTQTPKKPILAWFDNRLFLTDPQCQKVLCEFQIRTHHNGLALLSPEIALPEFPISQHENRANSA